MNFFTADTHFDSARSLDLSLRPYKNVKSMNKAIVRNWNKTVGKNDMVYHLGDFGELEFVKKLHGKVVLVLGNYEEFFLKFKFHNNFEEFREYLKNLGFFDAIENHTVLEVNGEPLYLTHRPMDSNLKYFNLFGHIHNLCMVKRFGLNVGIDCHEYKPINEETIRFYENAIKNHYNINIFCNEEDVAKVQKTKEPKANIEKPKPRKQTTKRVDAKGVKKEAKSNTIK